MIQVCWSGLGSSRVTDFPAGALQPHQCRIDADSEYGRDLRQRVSLNFFQQKHVAVSLGQSEGTQQGELKSARLFQSASPGGVLRSPSAGNLCTKRPRTGVWLAPLLWE